MPRLSSYAGAAIICLDSATGRSSRVRERTMPHECQSKNCQANEKSEAALNPRVPFIAAVLPVAAFALRDGCQIVDEFDTPDVFGHLVAELRLDAEPERRAVLDRQRGAVHLVGKDRLRMARVAYIDALVISIAAVVVVHGVKYRVTRGARGVDALDDVRERHAFPFCDRAPALDAVVARDLRARGQRL